MQTLHIGVTCWKPENRWDATTLCDQAGLAEQLGFDSYWLPENHFGENAMPSPLTQLAAVSACTSTIKLGTVSYLLPIRHPLQAAEEVAVVDQLCNGRLILGLGRGIQDTMFSAFGVDSKDKRQRFSANLALMRQAWTGDAIKTEGGTDDIRLSPLPVQNGGPPLWVAAFGPLALKQVAQLGLPYLASPMETLSELTANYTRFNTLVSEAKKPPVLTVPIMRTVFVHESSRLCGQVADALTRQAGKFRRTETADIRDWTLIGDRHHVQDKIAEYQCKLEMTHLISSGRLPGLEAEIVMQSLANLASLRLTQR
ncbi:MAG: LLM class flavin-dependent oxidoreductase [Halioglobus sp.]